MPIKLKTLSLFFILYWSSFFCFSNNPQISIKPAKTIINVIPGKTYNGHFLIFNLSDEEVSVDVTGEDWTEIYLNNRKKGIPDWLKINEIHFNIQPQKTHRLNYLIQMPSDTQGQILSQIFFSPLYTEPKPSSFSTRLGVLVLAIADGTQILEFGNEKLTLSYNESEQKFEYNFELINTGNVLISEWSAGIQLMSDDHILDSFNIDSAKSLMPTKSYTETHILNSFSPNSERLSAKITYHMGIHNKAENTQTKTINIEYKIPPSDRYIVKSQNYL